MIADVKKNGRTEDEEEPSKRCKNDLGKVRTGRAHTGLLDHITVDYYGTPTPIPQVANVTLIDARTHRRSRRGRRRWRRRSRRRSAIPISA